MEILPRLLLRNIGVCYESWVDSRVILSLLRQPPHDAGLIQRVSFGVAAALYTINISRPDHAMHEVQFPRTYWGILYKFSF